MSEKFSEKSEMSELVWASNVMRDVIAPPGCASSKGERVLAAAFALRWKTSRTKDVWYADERVSLKPHEIRKIEEVSGVTYGRQELQELDTLISRADAILYGAGAGGGRPFAHVVRALFGALDRTGTGGDPR